MTALASFGVVPCCYRYGVGSPYTAASGYFSASTSVTSVPADVCTSLDADISVIFVRFTLPDTSDYIYSAYKVVTVSSTSFTMDRTFTGTAGTYQFYYSADTSIYRPIELERVTEYSVETTSNIDLYGMTCQGAFFTLTYDNDGAVTKVNIKGLWYDVGYETIYDSSHHNLESYVFYPTSSQCDRRSAWLWVGRERYNAGALAFPVLISKWEWNNDSVSEREPTQIIRYEIEGIVREPDSW